MDDLVPPTRESTCMPGMVNARSCSVVIATISVVGNYSAGYIRHSIFGTECHSCHQARAVFRYRTIQIHAPFRKVKSIRRVRDRVRSKSRRL
ncbi:hypothetical protein DPMN_175999 [Dreissena polymorpha]|uniref:Uncharacterized protein n=1 Tax=Dreissena polymorpha TaxID=45954 RepID=A0A9D4EAF7_DREPO|nr:hypothetical protein DPMN_175999 [Dreissena polymorpha]